MACCRHIECSSQRLNSAEKRRELVLPSDAAPNEEVPAQADYAGGRHGSTRHFGSMSLMFGVLAILITVVIITAVLSRSKRSCYGEQANRQDEFSHG